MLKKPANLSYSYGLFGLSFFGLDKTNHMNQINQINKTNQIVYRMTIGVGSRWSGAGLGWIWFFGMTAVALQVLLLSSI